MTKRLRIRLIDVMVLAAIVGFVGFKMMHRAPRQVPAASFADDVDLSPLYASAVQADARLRSFESHAKTYMHYVSGPRSIQGQSNGFTYLDLIFRPQRYDERDIIYVKNKPVLARILETLEGVAELTDERRQTITTSRLISPRLLRDPRVEKLLHRLGKDLIRTAKVVNAIQSGVAVADSRTLIGELRIVAPPQGTTDTPWLSLPDLLGPLASMPIDDTHAGMMKTPSIPGIKTEFQQRLGQVWSQLRTAWQAEDAAAINVAVAHLASLFPEVAPALYPSRGRLAMESWYFRSKAMTWVWIIYAACVIPLLMSVIYKWGGARKLGMVMFIAAFLAHTASLGIRWYISGRFPNSNMFEAVTTAAWFGGAAAMILEVVARRTPFRNLFALGSAVASMAALMAAYFLPAGLDSGINNKMAALNDVWLYIHTNMIILAYALIAVAFVTALLFLRQRWCQVWDATSGFRRFRLFIIPLASGALAWSGYALLMHVVGGPGYELHGRPLVIQAAMLWLSSLFILFELLDGNARLKMGGRLDRASAGGAASFILGSPKGSASFVTEGGPTMSQVYDGATMVLMELSFITLWTGLVMGAIWADHSWGRPWGWDPKETFALNTFLIFLVLIHVRQKVRDKGLWTAILAVVGFAVMMFNWIAVNFVITGLHSYA